MSHKNTTDSKNYIWGWLNWSLDKFFESLQFIKAVARENTPSYDTASINVIGDITEGATINTQSGTLSMGSNINDGETILAGSYLDFTLTNSLITSTSIILFNIIINEDPDNDGGCPYITIKSQTNGSVVLRINNVASDDNGNRTQVSFKINFYIINP